VPKSVDLGSLPSFTADRRDYWSKEANLTNAANTMKGRSWNIQPKTADI